MLITLCCIVKALAAGQLTLQFFLSDDCRRPFPQDIEMRCGFLGQLTSGVTPNSAGVGGDMSDTGRGPRDDLPPPEKKMALNVHAGKGW